MQTVRKRVPFKLAEGDEGAESERILDEQEQEAVIENLREENDRVNSSYYLAVKVVVGLSIFLQLVTFSRNPLLTIYPIRIPEPSIPLPIIFVILSLFIHLNLALDFFSEEVRNRLQLSSPPTRLSYQTRYLLSTVAPVLSLLLNKPWQTTVWWCATLLVVFIVHTVMDAIQESNQGITELETMKYNAPGA